MESGMNDLTVYRLEKAREALDEAEQNIELRHFATSLNRSYYAVFHAMRAANSLHGFDSRKHSGVIAFFNKTFIKERISDHPMAIWKCEKIRQTQNAEQTVQAEHKADGPSLTMSM